MKLKLYNIINLFLLILFIKYFILLFTIEPSFKDGIVVINNYGSAIIIKLFVIMILYGVNNIYKTYIKITIKKD